MPEARTGGPQEPTTAGPEVDTCDRDPSRMEKYDRPGASTLEPERLAAATRAPKNHWGKPPASIPLRRRASRGYRQITPESEQAKSTLARGTGLWTEIPLPSLNFDLE